MIVQAITTLKSAVDTVLELRQLAKEFSQRKDEASSRECKGLEERVIRNEVNNDVIRELLRRHSGCDTRSITIIHTTVDALLNDRGIMKL